MTRSWTLLLALSAIAVVAVLVAPRALDRPGRGAPAAQVPPVAATPTAETVGEVARSTGIPRRALQAYVAAAAIVARDQPTCGIAWNTLAGIGSSESSHGAFGGAVLDADGVARPSIVGVALDGTRGNRAIRDTDDGRLDGDTTWDRAVGPLQFIPMTWSRWGADGDGDGRADPHDLDDAALAAARYLCASGGDLTASPGWSQAVLAYNNSGEYARTVSRTAAEYAESA